MQTPFNYGSQASEAKARYGITDQEVEAVVLDPSSFQFDAAGGNQGYDGVVHGRRLRVWIKRGVTPPYVTYVHPSGR